MITVIDVLREMGIEPSKDLSWKLGIKVCLRYKEVYGQLPPKDLRPKTCGVGVHCFALYPESFRAIIVGIINDQFDHRYYFAGRHYSLPELAELRGVSANNMQRRLQRYNVFTAVRG